MPDCKLPVTNDRSLTVILCSMKAVDRIIAEEGMNTIRAKLQIAIDGPAGAGKSTVAREVSDRLNLKYLDTGAMYRAIALKIYREQVQLSDLDTLKELLDRTFVEINENRQVFLDGEDVTEEIRQPHVNELVSPVSTISLIRSRLVDMQRAIADGSDGIIMEGRDIASRVLPNADFKFYLDASLDERARRRHKEQQEKGLFLFDKDVTQEIQNRDSIDSKREDSPLTVVPDAVVIDTTSMTFEEVVTKIVNTVSGAMH